MPAASIGAIDFYHFVPLSVTWTLAPGKVRGKQNLLASFSRPFHLTRMKSDIVFKQFT